MKTTVCRLMALAVLALGPSLASAQNCYPPNCWPQIPQLTPGPGHGSYYSQCGTTYGPMYCPRPGYLPYNGVVPGPVCKPGTGGNGAGYGGMSMPGGPGVMPTHPFARSPRDFFMIYD